MDHFATRPQFSSLSLIDLLRARDQFHPHLMHKANVVGTAIGRYLIRKDDPYPHDGEPSAKPGKKTARTLENSEVRSYSWPCVLVFVSRWEDVAVLVGRDGATGVDVVPKTIYLEDGRSVPVCIVEAPLVETAPPPIDPATMVFPSTMLAGGYPVIAHVQGTTRLASLGCLVTDGHLTYALTSRHVAGQPGEVLSTMLGGKEVRIGVSTDKSLGRKPFEEVYETWPGKHIYVNLDVGLIAIDDQPAWNPSVFGLGTLGPLADLDIYNLTLDLIACPVRAFGCASGRLAGQIAALFYRYRSVGGQEQVADFLIGPRGDDPLRTHPGDSGTIWVIETDDVTRDRGPIAVQWGGAVFPARRTRSRSRWRRT